MVTTSLVNNILLLDIIVGIFIVYDGILYPYTIVGGKYPYSNVDSLS